MCTLVDYGPLHSTKRHNTKVLASVVQPGGLDTRGVVCPVVKSSFVDHRKVFWTTAEQRPRECRGRQVQLCPTQVELYRSGRGVYERCTHVDSTKVF